MHHIMPTAGENSAVISFGVSLNKSFFAEIET